MAASKRSGGRHLPKKVTPAANGAASNTLKVAARPDDTNEVAITRAALRPSVQSAFTLRDFNKALGDLSLTELVAELTDQCQKVSDGNLGRAEAMLVTQAHTLDAMFSNLARRAAMNMGEYLGAADTYLRLALKAQSQCRTTLEALAEMKNPRPVAFVKQANIANGPQQVNNGLFPTSTHAQARTEDSTNQSNEQMAVTHEQSERLDPGATSAAGEADSDLEAVGTVQRPAQRARKS